MCHVFVMCNLEQLQNTRPLIHIIMFLVNVVCVLKINIQSHANKWPGILKFIMKFIKQRWCSYLQYQIPWYLYKHERKFVIIFDMEIFNVFQWYQLSQYQFIEQCWKSIKIEVTIQLSRFNWLVLPIISINLLLLINIDCIG